MFLFIMIDLHVVVCSFIWYLIWFYILHYFWINPVIYIFNRKKNVLKNPEYISGFQVYMYSTFDFKKVNMCRDVNQIDDYCCFVEIE